jgi:hypothetical protein
MNNYKRYGISVETGQFGLHCSLDYSNAKFADSNPTCIMDALTCYVLACDVFCM